MTGPEVFAVIVMGYCLVVLIYLNPWTKWYKDLDEDATEKNMDRPKQHVVLEVDPEIEVRDHQTMPAFVQKTQEINRDFN